MKTPLTPLFATLALAAPTVAQARHFPDDAQLLDLIKTRVEEGRAVGIVLGVLESDGTRRIVSYGEPGPGAKPLGAASVFEIGSITKAFTGILLADMVGRGEVALEDAVQDHAPEGVTIPARDGRKITLLDLATHRSSLPRLPDNMPASDPRNPYADYTEKQLHEFLSRCELTRDVGERYEYSNLGTGLLGHVLAARAGTDYESLVRQRILEPLGMTMSGITLSAEMKAWLAVGHDQTGAATANWDLPALAGAGALRSNMNDMLTFLEANTGEPTSDLERAMRVSHEARRDAAGNRVGLNWHITTIGKRRVVWHNGGTGGYRSFAGFDPDKGVGAVVLTNSAHGADDIGLHVINNEAPLAPKPVPPKDRVAVEVDREILAHYVGVYELAPEFKITVTLEDDGLHVQATKQPKFAVFPESATKFFLKAVDAQISFVKEGDDVTSLILHQGGANQTAKKIE